MNLVMEQIDYQYYIDLIFPWLTVVALSLTVYFILFEKDKWKVVYKFKTRDDYSVTFDSMSEAEENALMLGFKHFKKTKMVVNYSEKTITIS